MDRSVLFCVSICSEKVKNENVMRKKSSETVKYASSEQYSVRVGQFMEIFVGNNTFGVEYQRCGIGEDHHSRTVLPRWISNNCFHYGYEPRDFADQFHHSGVSRV